MASVSLCMSLGDLFYTRPKIPTASKQYYERHFWRLPRERFHHVKQIKNTAKRVLERRKKPPQTLSKTLLDLPDELLLEIWSYLFNDLPPMFQDDILYKNRVINRLAVNHKLRDLAKDFFFHKQRLIVSTASVDDNYYERHEWRWYNPREDDAPLLDGLGNLGYGYLSQVRNISLHITVNVNGYVRSTVHKVECIIFHCPLLNKIDVTIQHQRHTLGDGLFTSWGIAALIGSTGRKRERNIKMVMAIEYEGMTRLTSERPVDEFWGLPTLEIEDDYDSIAW